MSKDVQEKPVIRVTAVGTGEPEKFEVVVQDRTGAISYQVTMSKRDFDRLSGGCATPEECVHAAFLFLLDHEPKEAILRRFDVSLIERYFPDFVSEFARCRHR